MKSEVVLKDAMDAAGVQGLPNISQIKKMVDWITEQKELINLARQS
jgi:hypothetical protein